MATHSQLGDHVAVQPNLPIELPRSLISLPAEVLLEEFGSGGHAPGSGSAAALMGILSGQLVATVCKIQHAKHGGEDRQFEYVLRQIEGRIIPELKTLFQRDAEDFDKVIKIRLRRDAEKDPIIQRRLREYSLRLLENSTEIVFTIARRCLSLIDYGLIVFDGGPKKVRGDSGAAISSAIAGAMSALFIINLNLRSFQSGRWAQRKRAQAEQLYADIIAKQEDAFTRIVTLQPENVSDMQASLF